MNYKSLALVTLLMPFFCYGVTKNEARIQDLKEAQYQKALELKEIAGTIAGTDTVFVLVKNKDDVDKMMDRFRMLI